MAMTPEERTKMEKEAQAKGWVYPYCGGCGHRYRNGGMVPPEEAKQGKCHFCLEDEREAKRQ